MRKARSDLVLGQPPGPVPLPAQTQLVVGFPRLADVAVHSMRPATAKATGQGTFALLAN